jgi:hypothetical protein
MHDHFLTNNLILIQNIVSAVIRHIDNINNVKDNILKDRKCITMSNNIGIIKTKGNDLF